MPGLDGYETTVQIRKLDHHTHTPIIAITANSVPSVAERCKASGMNGVLSKPFTIADLRRAVMRWGNRTRAHAA